MGSHGAGNAAQNAAHDKAMAADANYQRALSYRNDISKMSIDSLNQLDKAISGQERDLGRQEALLQNIDPAIIEASQQALKLMRGEQAKTLAPMQAQRDQQRQKLLNSLREQLGPGAETSTAGMQALNKFDSETNSLFAGAQQQAIQSLGSTFSTFNQGRQANAQGAMNLGQLIGARNPFINTIGQANSSVLNAGQGLTDTAGWQHVGAMVNAQHANALQNQIIGAAIQGGTAYATGGASAAKPSAAGANPQSTVNYSSNYGPQAGESNAFVGNIG
jgi:hypothetical protein